MKKWIQMLGLATVISISCLTGFTTPASAATGTSTAFITVERTHSGYAVHWHCNTVGWPVGTVTIACDLQNVGGNRHDQNSCAGSTSCTTPNNTSQYSAASPTWTLVAKGCRNGVCDTDTKTI
jgi:hypothetical protein